MKKNLIKIIFLDIDGVLATIESVKYGKKSWSLVEKKQKLFKILMENTGAKIVLSSSWRKWDLETTKEFMKEEGFWFWDEIIGVTIRAYQYIDRTKKIHLSIPRGVEIQQWIDTNIHSNNGKDFKEKKLGKDYQYVIIDDDTDMLFTQRNNFVNTDENKGLMSKDVKKAIKILNQTISE
jgi:hypothetical protein